MTPDEVLDAFEAVQPGDGGDVRDGVIELGTIANHVVCAWQGSEGWWEARLDVFATGADDERPCFTVPLLQGPVWYEDSDTTLQDVVDWLRVITNSQADLDDHDCNEYAQPYTSDGPLGHGWECGRCGAFLQAG